MEIDTSLAGAVSGYWYTPEARHADGGSTRSVLAHDAWDLYVIRQDGTNRWTDYPDSLPSGCLVLDVGGSPRNNLSRAGAHQRVDGLAGRLSYHFFAIPLAVNQARRRRTDIRTASAEKLYASRWARSLRTTP